MAKKSGKDLIIRNKEQIRLCTANIKNIDYEVDESVLARFDYKRNYKFKNF
jgi:hypothetical protein